jgi:hypothetical protein
MKSGSADTRILAEAAKKQADKAETISTSIQQAVTEMRVGNSRAKDSLDKTLTQSKAALDASIRIAESQNALVNRQIQATQEQTELSERPWIAVSSPIVAAPMIVEKDGQVYASFQIPARNVGKSPAKEVWIDLALRELPDPEWETLKKLCERDNIGIPTFGHVVFSNDSLPQMAYRVQGKAMALQQDNGSFLLPPALIGCVRYKSLISGKTYYTGFIYQILILPPDNRGLPLLGITVDSQSGKVRPWPPMTGTGKDLGTGAVKIPGAWISFYPEFMGNIAK